MSPRCYRLSPEGEPRLRFGGVGLFFWVCALWLTLLAHSTLAEPAPADLNDPEIRAKVRLLYTQARFEILDQQYEQALKTIKQCLLLSPHARELVCLEGAILEELGRRGDAIILYKNLLAKDPKAYAYLRFELGYLYINAEEDDKALAQFKAAEKLDFKRAVREQAQLLMRIERYDQARKQLGRLPQNDPSVRYLEAQSLFHEKKFNAARKLIGETLAMKPDAHLAKDLKGLFAQVKAGEEAARPWRLWLTLIGGYNDNVFRDPLSDNPALQQPRDEGDFFWLARAVYLHRLAEGKKWALFATAGFLNMSYFTLNESDFSDLNGSIYWRYLGENWMLRIPLQYAYYFSGSSHQSTLQQFTLFPSFTWQMADNFATTFYGTLQRKIYFTNSSNITRWALLVTHYYYFGAVNRYLRFSWGFNQDIADDDAAGFKSYRLTLGGGRPIYKNLSFDLGLSYVYYDHNTQNESSLVNPDGTFGVPWDRIDHQFQLGFQLFYRPTPRFQLTLGYYLTNNDSNVQAADGFDPYNFRQNIMQLVALWSL